jgi:predicted nucleotidyltransferase
MNSNQTELSFEVAMQRLASEMQLEQIILFGSRARGDARADSDYDVLIVANGEPHELARQASRLLRGRRFALDLLALSREHIEYRLANSTLLKTIMREGKILYEA